MATAATSQELIEAIAAQMSQGIDCAVDFWMAKIEQALDDPGLNTLGRTNAVHEAFEQHRSSGGDAGGSPDGYSA